MKKLLIICMAIGMIVSCAKEENEPEVICKTCQEHVFTSRSTGNNSSYVTNLGKKCGAELKDLEGKSWQSGGAISQTQWQRRDHHITCY